MKRLMKPILAMSLLGAFAYGQQDGVPNFGAADVHETDIINLQTLVPTINIPVVSKNEAIPLGITLTAQQYCYTFNNVQSGTYLRECNGEFGAYATGLLNATFTYSKVQPVSGNCPNGGTATSYSAWYLLTSDGLDSHPISPNTGLVLNDPAHSGLPQGNCTATYAINEITIDGSGYTVSLSIPAGTLSPWLGSESTFSVTAKNGASINGIYSPTATVTDTFGNTASSTASAGTTHTYTDSLGVVNTATTVITGDRPTRNNGSVQYLDTNGNTQSITLQRSTTLFETDIAGTCKGAGQGYSIYPLQSINFPDSTSMSFTYEAGGVQNSLTGRVASFTTRQGGAISYQYPPACNNGGPSTLTRTTPDGTTTYSITLNGNQYVTTVLDPGQNKAVYYFGNTFLTEKDVYQNTGTVSSPTYTLLSRDVYCYNRNQTNCTAASGLAFPVTQRDVYHTIGGMSTSSHSMETYDTYGNVTSRVAYGPAFGSSSIYRTTTVTYGTWNGSACVSISSNIHDHPCDVKTGDGSGNTLFEVRNTYNPKGALTASSRWTGSIWLTDTYVPNANGTVASSTAANGLVTTYGYANGCNNLLPTTVSATVSSSDVLTSSTTWDCNMAVGTGTTDANGNTTSETYDVLGRPASYTDQSNYTTNVSYTSNSAKVSSTFSGIALSTTATVDSVDRPINVQTVDGSQYDTNSANYSWVGPNFVKGSSITCFEPLNSSCPIVSTATIDPLGRTMTLHNNGGQTIANTYNQQDVTTTLGLPPSGEHVKTSQSEMDALGRPTSTCKLETSGGSSCGEVAGGSGIVDTYSYSSASGSTTTSVTRGAQTHTSTADALGRVISSSKPESGTTQYFWDAAPPACWNNQGWPTPGDLGARKDNAGTYVCYGYDALHRLAGALTRPSGPCFSFVYDSATPPAGSGITVKNTAGRMVEAYTNNDCNGTTNVVTDEWFSYDKNGRTTDVWEMTPHSGGYYHTSVTYYANGTVNTLNGIPGYTTITYGLDGQARPITLNQAATNLITNVKYSASGKPTEIDYYSSLGGNDRDTYTFDSNTDKVRTYNFAVNGSNDNGTLSWNVDGDLGGLVIADGIPGATDSQTCSFAYDDVNRLVTDNCGPSHWNQTFTYDQYDNLNKTGNPGGSWNVSYNPANNQYTGIGANYDGIGNLTYDSFNTYSWDMYGEMISVNPATSAANCGTSGTCITYDAQGRPVEINRAGTYSELLYSPIGELAVMNGQTVTNAYIPSPAGGYVWTNNASGNNRVFQHYDWLGTVRLETNPNGDAIISDRAFSPYGEVYNALGTDMVNFTGDHQDILAGLFDTPNRELAQNQARWLTPDPAGASWNAYSYATNPNSNTDPLGLSDGDLAGFGGEFGEGQTFWGSDDLASGNSPAPAVKCEGWLCWLRHLFEGGSGSGPGPKSDPIGSGWDSGWGSFTGQAANARAWVNNRAQSQSSGQPAPTNPDGSPSSPTKDVPPLPDGKPPGWRPGDPLVPNEWVAGRGTADRDTRWGPKYPIPGQSPPNVSWDPSGHWDHNDGKGERTRWLPGGGGQVDHWGNPIQSTIMDRMRSITPGPILKWGTTGVVLYIVIDEGSRLYPPRNLVPVP